MAGEWLLDDLKELASAVLLQAARDYLRRRPGSHEHQSAHLFLYSNNPGWREVRRLWVTIAFIEKGGI